MQAAPIDLTPFRLGTAADRARVATELDRAGRESGFFAVTGHGVDPTLLGRMLEVTSEFFDRPIEEKMRCYVEDRAANRGYAPEGSEALAYSIGESDLPPDLFEAFNIGREIGEDEVDEYVEPVRTTFLAPNVWPAVPASFRPVWLEYWVAVEEVAMTLMRVAGVALGVGEEFFVPFVDRSISVIRANNYRRRAGAPEPRPDQMRMGAHTDYGSITVLLADAVPGLQIRDDGGVWHDILPPTGGFLVNIGDLLAEWTNDRWRSTMHRVVPPPPGSDGSAHRRSIAWFQQPNWDAEISCLAGCTDADHPARYRPVRSGDHLLAKLMGPRLLRPSDQPPLVTG